MYKPISIDGSVTTTYNSLTYRIAKKNESDLDLIQMKIGKYHSLVEDKVLLKIDANPSTVFLLPNGIIALYTQHGTRKFTFLSLENLKINELNLASLDSVKSLEYIKELG